MNSDRHIEALMLEFIDELEKLNSLDDMVDAFEKLIGGFGYDSFRCAEIVRRNEPMDPKKAFGRLDRDWNVHYREQDYVYNDSTVQMALQTRYPFTWSSLKENHRISSLAEKIFKEAQFDFRFNDGLLIPIHLADGSVSVVSIIGEKPDTRPVVNRALGMAAIYLHAKARPLISDDSEISSACRKALFSRRQLDCIQWVAEGKSDWEISKILGISEATVHNHVERAKRNLGVHTRIQAVVEAARRRLILL